MKDIFRQAAMLLIGLAIGAVAAYVVGRLHEPHTSPETVVIERVDTLVLRDTITAYKPGIGIGIQYTLWPLGRSR